MRAQVAKETAATRELRVWVKFGKEALCFMGRRTPGALASSVRAVPLWRCPGG